MNVAIINGKDILRYLLIIITGIVISFFIFNGIKGGNTSKDIQKETEKRIEILKNIDIKGVMRVALPLLGINEKENLHMGKNSNDGKVIFYLQVPIMNHIKSQEEESLSQEESLLKQEEMVDLAEEEKQTTVIEENNIAESYSNEYGDIKVKNETSFDISKELENPNYQFTNKKDILLFHTHTCESYTPTENYNYEMTGTYRTTDLNYSVARVGDELKKQLTAYGFNVTHDTTYHDYPAYSGSYGRSLKTVENLLNTTTSAEMVIDLHRDAVGSNHNYAPTVQIGEEYAAQLMLVMGTDGGGLQHPNWRQNFNMAVKIQKKANELYPGLFRPIILRNSRYNQHLTTGACIIEVGATGNSMEQCLTSMKYLSKVLNAVITE